MYKVNDKATNIRELNSYMLTKTLNMFEYSGLPDTVPQVELEKILQKNGFAFFTEHEGKLYALSGGLGGVPDVYGRATKINVNNPALGLNKTLDIEADGVLISSDILQLGLFPIFNRFNTLMVENYITMDMNGFMSRLTNIISASDDRTRESAENFIKKLREGETTIIGENAFFEGVKVHGNSSNASAPITSLIEYHQYLKASLYNEVGIDLPYNMKRERLVTAEVEQDSNSLSMLVETMLECRKAALEEINEKYGLEITVAFSGAWSKHNAEKSITQGVETFDSGLVEETEMKTIRQFLEGGKLWNEINEIMPLPFIDDNMDNLFIIEYGDMPLFSGIKGETIEDVASYAVKLFGDKWTGLLEAAGLSLVAGEVRTVEETETNSEERTGEASETNQTSGFNSETMVDDTGKNSDSAELVEGTGARTVEETKKSIKDAFDNLQRAEQLNIVKQAMADVAGFLKVQVY